MIATKEGQKPIEEIEVGDEVWSYNIETGEAKLNKVAKVFIHETDILVHLHTESGIIDTTTTHPFYVEGRGFVAAADLQEGDKIYALDGSLVEVKEVEIEKLDEKIVVYNLEVEENHTYFVGDEAVLVHNTCGGSKKSDVADDVVESGKTPKTYQTYTKTNPVTGEVYSGRTSGTGSPIDNVAKRDANHHMNSKGFGPAMLDKTSDNYKAIRGREQMLIDYYGGAKSMGGTSGNAINGIGAYNKNKDIYINAAKGVFGNLE